MARRTVVVLGGGIRGAGGGSQLRRRLPREDRVVLVERTARFSFPPSYLWVLSGVNLRRSGRIWHWSKVALEQYWLRMRPWGPPF